MPELDALYRDVILDHYRTPRGKSPLPTANVSNEGQNPLCGDEVTVSAEVNDQALGKVHVHGRGCSISVASGSMMADLLAGKSRREAMKILEAFKKMMHGQKWPEGLEEGDLDALQGVRQFPVRIKCALLPWTTLEDALNSLDAGRAPKTSSTEHEGGQS